MAQKMKSIKPVFSDKRGNIIDLIENEVINAVTIITFTKGAIRGNHYHKKTTQWNYVLKGKIKYVSQMPGKNKIETLMKVGDIIISPPNERHALIGIEAAEVLILTKGPRGGKEYESDTFRLENSIAN